MNFVSVTEDLSLCGFVATDLSVVTQAWKKRRKAAENNLVRSQSVRRVAQAVADVYKDLSDEFDEYKRERIAEYEESEAYRDTLFSEIKSDLDQAVSSAHDFLTLLSQIRTNSIAILEERCPGLEPNVAAEQLPNEGAIYFGTELLRAKFDSLRYLRDPSLLHGAAITFSVHPYVLKYVRIYAAFAKQKDLNIATLGSSYAKVRYASEPIGTVIHNVLDNVVKYAPVGSRADVIFSEDANGITLTFSSLGPEIGKGEYNKIFRPGYRANAARAREASGVGLGLAVAKLISDSLDLQLSVAQDQRESAQFRGFFSTTFSLRFRIHG